MLTKEREEYIRSAVAWDESWPTAVTELLDEIDELRSLTNTFEGVGYSIVSKKGVDNAAEEMLKELILLRKDSNEYKALLEELNSRIFPGSIDTADSLVQMKKERDFSKAQLVKYEARIDALKAENEALKNPSDGRCMEIGALREHNQRLRERLKACIESLEISFPDFLESPLGKRLAQDDDLYGNPS